MSSKQWDQRHYKLGGLIARSSLVDADRHVLSDVTLQAPNHLGARVVCLQILHEGERGQSLLKVQDTIV